MGERSFDVRREGLGHGARGSISNSHAKDPGVSAFESLQRPIPERNASPGPSTRRIESVPLHSTPIRPSTTSSRHHLDAKGKETLADIPTPAAKRPRGRPRKYPINEPMALPSDASSTMEEAKNIAERRIQLTEEPRTLTLSHASFEDSDQSARAIYGATSLSGAIIPSRYNEPGTEIVSKRKRGRPRKYPIDPNKEALKAATKAAASITPWRRIEAIDRPPVYPETHVMIPVRRMPIQSLWNSPVKIKPMPRPSWMYYERPLRADLEAKRSDGLKPEPLPTAPPGRRGRTRVNYAELAHWQLVCRARRNQLDPQDLWMSCVEQWRKAGRSLAGRAKRNRDLDATSKSNPQGFDDVDPKTDLASNNGMKDRLKPTPNEQRFKNLYESPQSPREICSEDSSEGYETAE